MVPANQSFPGGAFEGAEDEGVVIVGSINCSAYAVVFEAEGFTLSFPTQLLQVALDDAQERVLITHPNYPRWTIYSLDLEIVQHPALHRFGLRDQLAEVKEQALGPSRHTKMVYGVVGVIVALFLTLWLFANPLLGVIANNLPASWEAKIGQAAFKEIKEDFEFTSDPLLTNRVHLVAQRLKRGLPHDAPKFTFHVADSGVVNAFALPGGTVIVLRGLIEDASPEELAGVLAHEMAHITEKHSMRELAQRQGPLLIAKYVFGGDGALAMMTAGAAFFGHMKYSRENERAADNEAWEILVRANIDPRGLTSFFRKLEKTEGKMKIPDMFSTHPPTSDRIGYLEDRWSNAPKKSGFEPIAAGPQPPKKGPDDFFK